MPRYALKLEYDGRPFAGWQRQDRLLTAQGVLEAALSKLEPAVPSVAAAGRTDAGVHALGQVAQCDLAKDWTPFRLSEALNHHLKPHPVAVIAVAHVEDDWHARFSAIERRYLYRMICRRAPLVFQAGRAWRVPSMLDVETMQSAANVLIGQHDFTTFRASECQARSPVKTLDALRIEADGDEIQFHVRARSFLHSQVRSFVGTLERVGAGAWSPERVRDALEARERSRCGPVAPPDGLYLAEVRYAEDVFNDPPSSP